MTCEQTIELCIDAGDDVSLPFRMLDSVGDPVNITGYSFNLDSEDDSLDKVGVIDDAANGEFSFNYTRVETAAMNSSRVSAKITQEVGGFLSTITRALVTVAREY